MRKPFAAVLMLGLASVAMSQEGRQKTEAEPPPRFGVNFKGRVYPQATPREALTSLIEAAEKGDANYLVAHLLEPSFVDARMADRAKQFEPQVEANLAALRDYQQKNLDRVAPEVRVPVDAVKFRDRVQTDAKAAAFKQLVKDVQEKFVEDPETMKAMRLYRSGTFPENPGDLVKLGHVDVKNRVLFIKKIADRYYIENRQSDGAEARTEPEKK